MRQKNSIVNIVIIYRIFYTVTYSRLSWNWPFYSCRLTDVTSEWQVRVVLVLIQTSLLLLCKQVVHMLTRLPLHGWEKQRGLYQSKVNSSRACIHGQVTKHITVKWPIEAKPFVQLYKNISDVKLLHVVMQPWEALIREHLNY